MRAAPGGAPVGPADGTGGGASDAVAVASERRPPDLRVLAAWEQARHGPGGDDVEVTWHPLGDVADGGARVPVLPLGDPSGPPMVLVPGLTDGLHPVSRPAARRLFDDLPVPMGRCRGLVVSYRHPLDPPVTTEALARDLAAVLDVAVAGPSVILAHSMGTMVAQHLAAARPDLVAGLVLSAPLVEADAALSTVVDRWAALVREGRWAALAEDALTCSYTGEERRRRRELAAALPPDTPDDVLRDRHLALSDAALRHDASAVVGDIEAPTLILAGEEDPIARPEQARRLASLVHGARLHVLPGLAHGFPEQASPRFTALVTSFLGEVAATCAAWTGAVST